MNEMFTKEEFLIGLLLVKNQNVSQISRIMRISEHSVNSIISKIRRVFNVSSEKLLESFLKDLI